MDDVSAERALAAYLALVRVARYPRRDPSYTRILADLMLAEKYYQGLERTTPIQNIMWHRITSILHL